MKISELQKIRTEQNTKTIDKAIAFIKELQADLDHEQNERIRLEERMHRASRWIESVKQELALYGQTLTYTQGTKK